MSRIFDKNILLIISCFCLPLLFFPKLNLIQFKDETAGIRIDDIVLLFLCFFLGWAFLLTNKKLIQVEKYIFLIVIFSFFSFISNRLLVATGQLSVDAKVFYVFRIIEYFLFFYVGCILTQFVDSYKLIKAFLFVNVLFMIFQKFGLIGRFTQFGSSTIDTGRVSGLASFPAEMGALLSMIFCYLLFDENTKTNLFKIKIPAGIRQLINKRNFSYFLIFSFLVVLTGARVALASVFFLYFLFQINSLRSYRFCLFMLFLLLSIPLLLFFFKDNQIAVRSAQLFSFNNIYIIINVWNNIDVNIPLYENIKIIPGDYDLSWWIRIHKWCYAAKLYLYHPECYLQGIGPGTCSAALDGSFLRILVENGLIGFFLYWNLFRWISVQSQALMWVVMAFCMNMIFFDIYLAYKPMSLLFLLTGCAYSKKQIFLKKEKLVKTPEEYINLT